MHSALSSGEKYDGGAEFTAVMPMSLSARSSIFAPVQNLGIIIMDEEHGLPYKQDENPKCMPECSDLALGGITVVRLFWVVRRLH